jgi:hypothetical protein
VIKGPFLWASEVVVEEACVKKYVVSSLFPKHRPTKRRSGTKKRKACGGLVLGLQRESHTNEKLVF